MQTPNGVQKNKNELQLQTDERPSQNVLVKAHNAERRQSYGNGWRAGKPEEDPAKMKKWGLIQAKPSEFLIQMRGGQIRLSGQGASCFKLPWDSVAIVPTTVQQLQFVADQVTSEKVGVQVSGLAVYRIADPLIAFRMLNFSFPERAQQKLEELLGEMFVGAARRLVANLSVEQCLTKRKEGIAGELMKEIAPVVSGVGRVDDRTVKGWGVVVDTIEIQDVRVLSQNVFANMQARFRQEQERVARAAELAKEKAVRQDEAEAERLINLTKLNAEIEVRERRQAADEEAKLKTLASEQRVVEASLGKERQAQLVKIAVEQEIREKRQVSEEQAKLAELSLKARLADAQREAERQAEHARMQLEVERAQLQAQAEAARHQAEVAKRQQEMEVLSLRAQAAAHQQALVEAEVNIAALESKKLEIGQLLELERVRAQRAIENSISPEAIQLAVAQQLPQLAAAFQQKMGEVHVTSVDGANPFGYIAAAVEGVMGLARSAGLKVPALPDEKP